MLKDGEAAKKPSTCSGCEFYQTGVYKEPDTYNHLGGDHQESNSKVDILVMSTNPSRLGNGPFTYGTEGHVRKLFEKANNESDSDKKVKVGYCYGIRCLVPEGEKMGIDSINHCRALLIDYIERLNPKVVIALGASSAKSLGFGEGIKALRGSTFERKIGKWKGNILVSFHPYDVKRRPGLFSVLKNDLMKAFNSLLRGKTETFPSIVAPTAFDDVMASLEDFKDIFEKIKDEDNGRVFLAMDTETTSVKINNSTPDGRMIAMSMAFARHNTDPTLASKGLSCFGGLAFPIDHKEAEFSEEQVDHILAAVKDLVQTPGVTPIFYNAKYDLKWLALHPRYAGKTGFDMGEGFPTVDCMLQEHFLDEDKKGEYSLKQMTVDYFPEYGKYEKEMKDKLAAVQNQKNDEYKSIVLDISTRKLDLMMDRWVGIPEQRRSSLLGRWIDEKYLSFEKLRSWEAKYKFNPRVVKTKNTKKSGVVITKAYRVHLERLFKLIPLEELSALDVGLLNEEENLQFELPDQKEITNVTFEDIPLKDLLWYAAMDAVMTRKIFELQRRRLLGEDLHVKRIRVDMKARMKKNAPKSSLPRTKPTDYVRSKFSIPLCRILTEMEFYGIRLDIPKTQEAIGVLEETIGQHRERLFQLVGKRFNPNSSDVLGSILFNEFKLEPKKTSQLTGRPSVDAESLRLMLEDQPDLEFLKTLLTMRKMEKVHGTYLSSWLKKAERSGRIYASFNQIGTATHRLSSSNPNLQNVPFKLKEANLNLKQLFITDDQDRYDFYDLDIANAEMRVLCAYSKDETLINAFKAGQDLHCLTAAGVSDVPYEQIYANKEDKSTEEYKLRQVAKAINFLTIYGGGASTLVKNIHSGARIVLTEEQAQGYLTKFFETYPGVSLYMNETINMVANYGITYTFTGHRRHFPAFQMDRCAATRMGRQAVNARIQTTSSILVNYNMICLANEIKERGWDGRVLLTVHDSIAFQLNKDIPKAEVKEVLDKVVVHTVADEFTWLPVPWAYDCAWGDSYGTCVNGL